MPRVLIAWERLADSQDALDQLSFDLFDRGGEVMVPGLISRGA